MGRLERSLHLVCLTLLLFGFCDLRTAKARRELGPVCEVATYEEVKDIPNHPEKYLIDVRSREELAETGSIPASINIPLPELKAALLAPDDQFQQQYGRKKPAKDDVIIFSCRSGKRAQAATAAAMDLGYVNSKPYLGSWLDWAKREGLEN